MRWLQMISIGTCALICMLVVGAQIMSLKLESKEWKRMICQMTDRKQLLINVLYFAILGMNLAMISISVLMELNCSICDYGYTLYRDLYIFERVLTYIFFSWRYVSLFYFH